MLSVTQTGVFCHLCSKQSSFQCRSINIVIQLVLTRRFVQVIWNCFSLHCVMQSVVLCILRTCLLLIERIVYMGTMVISDLHC